MTRVNHGARPAGASTDPELLLWEREQDRKRISAQRQAVFDLMKDGEWRTLREIEEATGYPQASISARLRDFRKRQYGGFTVWKSRSGPGRGTYRYAVLVLEVE